MLNPLNNRVLGPITWCCILIFLLLLGIAALLWFYLRQKRAYKKLAEELPSEAPALETDVPKTDAPETDVPETDALETDVPKTDTLETDVPEDEDTKTNPQS